MNVIKEARTSLPTVGILRCEGDGIALSDDPDPEPSEALPSVLGTALARRFATTAEYPDLMY